MVFLCLQQDQSMRDHPKWPSGMLVQTLAGATDSVTEGVDFKDGIRHAEAVA